MTVEKELKNIVKLDELPLVDLAKIFFTKVVDLENNRLHTDTALTVGDVELGAVELKDHDSDERAVISTANGVQVDPTRKAPESVSVETDSKTGENIDKTTSGTDNWKLESLMFARTNAEAITLQVYLKAGVKEFLIHEETGWTGKNFVIVDGFKLDSGTQVRFKTTGVTTGTLDLRIIKTKI